MKALKVISIGAVTPGGLTWDKTRETLLRGEGSFVSCQAAGLRLEVPVRVSAVPGLDRSVDARGVGPTARLIQGAIRQMDIPKSQQVFKCWGSFNHGEDISNTGVPRTHVPVVDFPGGCQAGWIASACTSGLHALYMCWLEARTCSGSWVAVSGDALSEIGVAGFFAAGATGNGDPTPLRDNSPGMRVGEGAVALHLSNTSDLPCPAIRGMAMTSDADHPTHSNPEGIYLEEAIRGALSAANVLPADVSVVVAHGTGTAANDGPEAGAISRIWKRSPVVVTSAKGTIGHIMGAAGLLNVAIAAEYWRSGQLPPSLGFSQARASLQLSGADLQLPSGGTSVVVASGFGGNNVVAVVG